MWTTFVLRKNKLLLSRKKELLYYPKKKSSDVYLPHSVAFIIALLRNGTLEHMAATIWFKNKTWIESTEKDILIIVNSLDLNPNIKEMCLYIVINLQGAIMLTGGGVTSSDGKWHFGRIKECL